MGATTGTDKAIIAEAASRYGIEPKVLYGLYGTETGFGRDVKTSSAGAVGPFQFEPDTARSMGVNPYDFKSAAFGAARYLAQYKSRGVGGMLSAYNAGPAGGYQDSYVKSVLKDAQQYGTAAGSGIPAPGSNKPAVKTETSSFDRAGFESAEKRAESNKMLDSYLGSGYSGLFSTKAPEAAEYTKTSTTSKLPGAPSAGNTEQSQKGLTDFGGKRVAAWIAPILQYAKQQGWKGQVTSGYRSKAEQERIYNSGVRPAAVPGTSNHEGTEYPRGAVDVTEAETLNKILQRSPYNKKLEWAGSTDPVHFSKHHDGSY